MEKKYLEAEEILNQCLALPKLTPLQKAIIFHEFGVLYLEKGRFRGISIEVKKARDYFNQCLSYLEKKDLEKKISKSKLRYFRDLAAKCFFNRGQCFYYLEDYQRAAEDFSEAFRLGPVNYPLLKLKEAKCYLFLGEGKKAEEILEELAKKTIKEVGPELKLEIFLSLGVNKLQQNKIKAAEEILEKTEKIIEEMGEEAREFLSPLFLYKSEISLFRKEHSTALNFALQALDAELNKLGYGREDLEKLSENIPVRFLRQLSWNTFHLGEIYALMGETEESLKYFQLSKKFGFSKKGELERKIVRLKRATKVKKRVKEIRMLPSGPLLKELQLPGKIAFPALPSISQAGVLADLGREERFQKIARVLKEIVWGEDLIEMAREYGEKVEPMKRKIQEIDNEKKKRAIAKEIEELKDSFTFRLACRNPEKILSLNLEELSRYLEEVYKKIYQ